MLFSEIVFGPVKSRRLGVSLGINILPLENKFCNFNCIYCECGWTVHPQEAAKFIPATDVISAIESAFSAIAAKGEFPDVITFAGNGEPTMHPEFAEIMEATVRLRNRYMPGVKICVLSNSLLAGRKKVFDALMLADRRIMKLDAGNERMFDLVDQANGKHQFGKILENLRLFKGKLEIQTIFFSGNAPERSFDTAAPAEVNDWLKCVERIQPEKVQIYTLDRPAPAEGLQKTPVERLEEIAAEVRKAGIIAEVYR